MRRVIAIPYRVLMEAVASPAITAIPSVGATAQLYAAGPVVDVTFATPRAGATIGGTVIAGFATSATRGQDWLLSVALATPLEPTMVLSAALIAHIQTTKLARGIGRETASQSMVAGIGVLFDLAPPYHLLTIHLEQGRVHSASRWPGRGASFSKAEHRS